MRPKALFLDRDGVVNIDKGYVFKICDFEFVEGIFDLCKLFQSRNHLIFIITNQSGIARNYYTEADFDSLTKWMLDQFEQQEVRITKVFHCSDHPDDPSTNRKPNPGMIRRAAVEYNLDLKHSVLIGDKRSDIAAAKNSGIKKYLQVETNHKVNLKHFS